MIGGPLSRDIGDIASVPHITKKLHLVGTFYDNMDEESPLSLQR